MTLQYSVAIQNAQLDVVESQIGVSALLRFYTGAQPANCAAAATGIKLAELPLPADWMNAAAAGVKTLKGSWTVAAIAAGTAGYFRLYDTTGTTCGAQGSVTATGGDGDITMNSNVLSIGQTVTEITFTLTTGNP